MKRKSVFLISAMLLLAGCNNVHNGEKTDSESIQQESGWIEKEDVELVSKDGNTIKIAKGEKFQDILEKIGFEYSKSFEEKDKVEVGRFKHNDIEYTVQVENFRIGHEFVDAMYGIIIEYKTKESTTSFCFNSSFSDQLIAEMKLENVFVE